MVLILTGFVSGFSPVTVVAGSSNATVTISGVALDPSVSVRAVRFEPGSGGCTFGRTGAAAGTVDLVGGLSVVNGSQWTLVSGSVGGSGLSSGQYAVCVDLTSHNSTTGGFVQAGALSQRLLVGECRIVNVVVVVLVVCFCQKEHAWLCASFH